MRAHARCSQTPASACSSTARKASRPTTATCSARRPICAICFVAAGFNSIGIQSAGGAGKALAEWIVDGHPPIDLWDVDIRRVMPFQTQPRAISPTARSRRSACCTRCTGRIAAGDRARRAPLALPRPAGGSGAVLRRDRRLGARQLVRARRRRAAHTQYSYGRQNWFDALPQEHRAVRKAVALFDQTSFGKFRVEGRDAEAVLKRICANDVDVPAGQHRLHAMAQRERRHRGRPHRHARWPRSSSSSSPPRRTRPAISHWLQRHIGPTMRSGRDRCHLGLGRVSA